MLDDFGPNGVSTIGSSYSFLSSGHSNQAISFTGASSSYFQASGFAALGTNNQAYSFSLWVQPQSLAGSLVHISTLPNGTGLWCMSVLGFALNGTLVAQGYDGSIWPILAPSFLTLSPRWSHVVQTWSSVHGLRLYVNNVLVASRPTLTTFMATGKPNNYVTLANSLSASGTCGTGVFGILRPFQGAIDDFKAFSRELSASDVCTLYST
jgi:Concanavalin A-like lectin/glucanases superfamily